MKSLVDTFSEVVDPRIPRTRVHPIENVLTIALLAVIAGAEGWEDARVERDDLFVEALQAALMLPNELRLERPVAVAGHANRDWPRLRLDRLRRVAVTAVARLAPLAALGAEML